MTFSAISGRLNNFLHQPYPYYYRGRSLVILSVFILVAIFLFNYLFKPFIVYEPEQRMSFALICLIHAAVPSILYFLFFYILQLAPKIDEVWNVQKEIIAVVSLLLLIGIGQFLVRDIIYNNPNNWSWRYFFEECRNTILVGILFSFVFVPVNFNRLYRSNRAHAKQLRPLPDNNIPLQETSIVVQTQVKADDFLLDASRLLFARAEKNYVEFYLHDHGNSHKLLKRISMKELEARLAHLPFLMKTHRSYLVNLLAVEVVTGNAQGYKLKLKGHAELVPVSRNLIPSFEEKRQSLG